MTPQEINVACATEVGLIKDGCQRIGGCLLKLGLATCCCQTGDCDGQDDIPNYHGDANAALGLCELMRQSGNMAILTNLGDGWGCLFLDSEYRNYKGQNQSLSAAICECFLRVKGKWRE